MIQPGSMIPDRPALDTSSLDREIGDGWRVEVRVETGSTNADAVAAARAGAPEGLVVTAEAQTAGRGRLGRVWQSPPRAGLALSVLLRPTVDMSRWGWLSLLAGVALAETVRRDAGLPAAVDAGLKWPNDLLISGRKCAGLLAEVAGAGAVVVGIGLNVTLQPDELPPTPSGLPATSLLLQGAANLDRTVLTARLLARLQHWYGRWQAADGDPDGCGLRAAYVHHCGTLGRAVRVMLPGQAELIGEATAVDRDGRLIVYVDGVERPVAAGDVLHLR